MAMDPKQFQELLDQIKGMSDQQREQMAKATGGGANRNTSSGSGKLAQAAGTIANEAQNASKNLLDSLMNIKEITGPVQTVAEQFRLIRMEQENLFQAGYSDKMFDFASSMEAAAKESFRLNGNIKAFAKTQDAMRNNFKGLGFVSEDFRTSIMKTGVALQTAGFDMNSFAGIVDSATFSFNQSEGQINDIAATLIKTSREFAIAPKELTENFQFAQKNFAYTSGKLMDNFLQLQKMSRTTGVGFQRLAQSFGGSMDEFAGSAQMAGRLNQILGKSMFNSIDLLNKTEAERAETIRSGILQRFGNRVGEMQKFELLAIGKTLNMSAEETRRFLRGEPPKAAKDMEKLQKKTPAEMASANLGNELDQLKTGVTSFRTSFERNMIAFNSKTFDATMKMDAFAGGITNAMKQMSARLALEKQMKIGDREYGQDTGFGFQGTGAIDKEALLKAIPVVLGAVGIQAGAEGIAGVTNTIVSNIVKMGGGAAAQAILNQKETAPTGMTPNAFGSPQTNPGTPQIPTGPRPPVVMPPRTPTSKADRAIVQSDRVVLNFRTSDGSLVKTIQGSLDSGGGPAAVQEANP